MPQNETPTQYSESSRTGIPNDGRCSLSACTLCKKCEGCSGILIVGVLGEITPRTENTKEPTFSREFLETYPALDWHEFVANYEEIKRLMGWDVPNRNSWEMEDYRKGYLA